jgi:small-conductance mechanosensitive channel
MMRDMIVSELTQATQEFARELAHLLPRLLVMLIIALVGWIIAYLVKVVLRKALRLVKFDRLSESAGATQLLTQAALPSSSELLSRLVFWVTWVGFVLAGLSALGIVGLQEDISRFFLFLPRLLVAILILFFGMLASTFFSRGALLAAVNASLPSPQVLSYSVRVVILVLAVSMAFEEIGVAEHTILVAFSIVFGALMLSLAIAFGIGGRDLARRTLERRFSQDKKEKKEDELSPL